MTKWWPRLVTAVILVLTLGSAQAQSAWRDLQPEQQRQLKQYAEAWDQLPEPQRERILRGLERWQAMTPEQRRLAQQRLQQWRALPEEERDRLRTRFQQYLAMSPEQRQALRERYRWFNDLPEAERQQLRQQWQGMTPEERRRIQEQRRPPAPRPTPLQNRPQRPRM